MHIPLDYETLRLIWWVLLGVLLIGFSLTVSQIWATIIGFTALYGTLAVIEIRLMIASIRKGPIEHNPGETQGSADGLAPLPAE